MVSIELSDKEQRALLLSLRTLSFMVKKNGQRRVDVVRDLAGIITDHLDIVELSADELDSLTSRLSDKLIGRRPS